MGFINDPESDLDALIKAAEDEKADRRRLPRLFIEGDGTCLGTKLKLDLGDGQHHALFSVQRLVVEKRMFTKSICRIELLVVAETNLPEGAVIQVTEEDVKP